MGIDTKIVDEETVEERIDHDIWIAQKASEMGFPVAGFIEEIYEDCVVLIPPIFQFDWGKKKVKIGRVVHIQNRTTPMTFILLMEDGTQVPCMYGYGYRCFFALPEDTKNFCVV